MARPLRVALGTPVVVDTSMFIALAALLDAELVTADREQAATSSCRVRTIG